MTVHEALEPFRAEVIDVLADIIIEGRRVSVLTLMKARLPHLTEVEIRAAISEIARVFVAQEEARIKARIAST